MADPEEYPAGVDSGLLGGDTLGRLQNQWNMFLGDPNNQRMMLQAGLAMMAPPSFGDNTMSQIGRGIGAAGEAQSRYDEQVRKERESLSKEDLRAMQAQLAESRSRSAGQDLDLKREKLQNERERLQATRLNTDLQTRVKLHLAHDAEVKAVKARNAARLKAWEERGQLVGNPKPEMEPEPTLEESFRRFGAIATGLPSSVGPQLPPGTVRSPSTGIYKTPDGRYFDASGNEIAAPE